MVLTLLGRSVRRNIFREEGVPSCRQVLLALREAHHESRTWLPSFNGVRSSIILAHTRGLARQHHPLKHVQRILRTARALLTKDSFRHTKGRGRAREHSLCLRPNLARSCFTFLYRADINCVITFAERPAHSDIDLFLFLNHRFSNNCFSSASFFCRISNLYCALRTFSSASSRALLSLSTTSHSFFTTPSLCDAVSLMLLSSEVSFFDFPSSVWCSASCLSSALSCSSALSNKAVSRLLPKACFFQPPFCLPKYRAFFVEIFFGRPLNGRLS